ncbi:hypothetical protein T484DRAFT_1830038 [Baffinella frigidus]|nr:hypothetical protein T484DRAFT_1830038 [Cryptophyta sp. CCMP2293]
MRGIEKEMCLPTGKIVPIVHRQPDAFYKELGAVPTDKDAYSGTILLFINEAKIMRHPRHTEGGNKDLYIEIRCGDQVCRTGMIHSPFHEDILQRFEILVSGLDAEESIVLSLCLKHDRVLYDPVPLGAISCHQVMEGKFSRPVWVMEGKFSRPVWVMEGKFSRPVRVMEGKFSRPVWVVAPAIVNASLNIRCLYHPFREPLKTLSSQYSPSREFVGGTSDWTPASERASPLSASLSASSRGLATPVGSHKRVGKGSDRAALWEGSDRAASPGSRDSGAAPVERTSMWKELLPRRQFKGICWVTLHEAQNLVGKIIGTRDPYVRFKMAGQTERSAAKVS